MSFVPATRTLIISPQYLKDNSVINNNTEDTILQVCIRHAEDKYIHPLIGSRLMERVTNDIASYQTGGTINAAYKILIDDYITPCLIEYSIYEYVPYSFKFRNKGISRQSSPDSIPADLNDLGYIRETVQSSAQFYGDRLVTYLKSNTATYTEYYQVQLGDIQPARNDSGFDIFIPFGSRGLGDCIYGMGFDIPFDNF